MKKIFRLVFFTAIFCCIVPCVTAEVSTIDSLRQELSRARTGHDSLMIAVNIFDLSPSADKIKQANEVYNLAVKEGDNPMQLDMLRHLCYLDIANDSMQTVYLARAYKTPRCPEQQNTAMLLKLVNTIQAARTVDDPHSRVHYQDMLNRANASGGRAAGTRLEVLFSMCVYLEQLSRGELLTSYLDRIQSILDTLPSRHATLESMFYNQAAITYTAAGDTEKAVVADKNLITVLDSIERIYHSEGRPFFELQYHRYTSYRRMLSNYRSLTADDVEQCVAEIERLAAINPEVMRERTAHPRVDIYHHMYHKEYNRALPLLKREVASIGPDPRVRIYIKRMMYECLIEAAEATNDRDALMLALMGLRHLGTDSTARRCNENFRELQLIYEANTDRLMSTELELQKRRMLDESNRTVKLGGTIALIVLAVAGLILFRVWRQSRRLNVSLEKTNAKLTEERDNLQRIKIDLQRAGEKAHAADRQKAEFINNMSHEVSTPLSAVVEYSQLIADCIDDDKKPYLSRFADTIRFNSNLVTTILNDVLELASSDRSNIKVNSQLVSVKAIAAQAIDTVRPRVPKDIELIDLIATHEDVFVDTDGRRVIQVLLNLLINATKFTQEGSIVLDGSLNESGTRYTFSVTDTGPGIPPGKEEIIFERFTKLSKYTQGVGLGLSVCRVIATALDGEVVVDTKHQGPGARFIFTIPVKK